LGSAVFCSKIVAVFVILSGCGRTPQLRTTQAAPPPPTTSTLACFSSFLAPLRSCQPNNQPLFLTSHNLILPPLLAIGSSIFAWSYGRRRFPICP
jgi:hypothetical protein